MSSIPPPPSIFFEQNQKEERFEFKRSLKPIFDGFDAIARKGRNRKINCLQETLQKNFKLTFINYENKKNYIKNREKK